MLVHLTLYISPVPVLTLPSLLTTRLNNINLRLVDEDNLELNLNGIDWAITMEVRDVDDKGWA